MNELRHVALSLALVLAFSAPAYTASTINVKTFGATGDGVTDDTTAIKKAFAAAGASGASVFFPPGIYLYSQNLLASGITVFGQNATLLSKNNANLQLTGNRTMCRDMKFSSESTSDFALVVSNAKNFSILGNSFDTTINVDISGDTSTTGRINGNALNLPQSGKGVEFAQSQQITVDNNSISGGSTGIAFASCGQITIATNRVNGAATPILLGNVNTGNINHNTLSNYSDVGTETFECVDLKITSNALSDTPQSPVIASMISSEDSKVVIQNNLIQNARSGILIESGSTVQVQNNTLNNIKQVAITVFGTSRPNVSNNGMTGSAIAVILNGNSNSSVTSNKISNCDAAGIVTEFGQGSEQIEHNNLRNCGLHVQGSPTAVIFVESPDASSIPIEQNIYEGNTTGLQYFIRCFEPQPPADVFGNITHTGLPNKIGP